MVDLDKYGNDSDVNPTKDVTMAKPSTAKPSVTNLKNNFNPSVVPTGNRRSKTVARKSARYRELWL